MCPGRKGERRKAKGESVSLLVVVVTFAFCLSPFAFVGCRQKMANQARYDPFEPSDFFEDGMSARPRIAGTVARGEQYADSYLDTGKINGQDGTTFPFAITAQELDRGQERYDIYCSACHGRTGDGAGMIPARGYRRPPSFHTEKLRAAVPGHFFDVMTNGFGSMPPYRQQVSARDRWAIAAYVRTLQISHSATIADVPPEERAKLSGGAP